jgi:hypothetical protein
MTIGRILGFVAGTILMGIGVKCGELIFKQLEKKFKEKMEENKKEAEVQHA